MVKLAAFPIQSVQPFICSDPKTPRSVFKNRLDLITADAPPVQGGVPVKLNRLLLRIESAQSGVEGAEPDDSRAVLVDAHDDRHRQTVVDAQILEADGKRAVGDRGRKL